MRKTRSLRFQVLGLVAAVAIPLIALQVVTSRRQYRLAVRQAQQEVLRLAEAVGASANQFTSLAEAQMTGVAQVVASSGMDPESCRSLVPRLHPVLPFLKVLSVVDANGDFVCSTLPVPSPELPHVREAEWFHQVLEHRTFYISPPKRGTVTDLWISVLVAPVFDETGRFVGAVQGGIDLVRFENLLAGMNLPPDVLVTITDSRGQIMARSQEAHRFVGGYVPPEVAPAIPVTENVNLSAGPDLYGVDRTWSRRVLPPLGWRVYVGIPSADVVAPARASLIRLVLLGLAISGLGMALGVGVYRRVSASIRVLGVGARAAADGRRIQVPEAVPVEVRDVVEQLNRTLEARSRAEESERRAQAHFLSIFEHATFGICLGTRGGRFLEVNPALVAMLGYESTEELLSQHVADLYVDPDQREAIIEAQVEDGTYENVTVDWRRKDDSAVTVRLNGRVLHSDDGQVFVTIVEDITGERALEEQLRQTQKLEAIGRLAGGVAHDFNNLLTVIIGHVRLMLERAGRDPEDESDAQQILAASERAASLTRQLLSFSRRKVSQPQSVQVSRVVEDLHKMLTRLIGEDIELVTELSSDPGPVLIDPVELEQVVVNLVVNARDAMPEGGRIVLRNEPHELAAGPRAQLVEAEPGCYARLTVTDNGTGMTEEVRSRAFEPFFTTKPVGKGTGLGLSTVYGIVRQAGGTVTIDSVPREGTTFEILLPLARTAEEPDRPPAPARPASGNGLTVLVVEDEEDVRTIVARVLKRAGYQVLVAADPNEALDLSDRHPGVIDLMVTDMVMPVMKGVDLAERLAYDRPEMPVLFMSGYTDGALAQERIRNDPAIFLAKPFGPVELLQRVARLIEREPTLSGGRGRLL